jgi:hypothetical protein
MSELVETVHYCKADNSNANPVHVTDVSNKTVKKTNKWTWTGIESSTGRKVRFTVEFKNSKGKAKASGASTVLNKEYLN